MGPIAGGAPARARGRGLSKLVFIVLVLAQGSRYLGQQAGIAIAIDAVWVVLFALYLAATRGREAGAIHETAESVAHSRSG